MSHVSVSTQKKDALKFRFGQDFDNENIDFMARRTPYASKLTCGVVDNAIKGFDVLDVKTKKLHKESDKIMEAMKLMMLDIKKAMFYDRKYGKSLFRLSKIKEKNIGRAYPLPDYFVKYDEFAEAEMYTVIDKVGGTHAVADQKEFIDDELNALYEIIIREGVEKGTGMSVLEPVWDTLFSLGSIDENATYYAIRYGAGIRYMKIPEAKFKNAKFMANIMKMLKGALGANGVYALPYATVNNVKEEFSIESETATQINFLTLRDLLLGSLSAQTGIPREIFLGSQLGLRSSEKNEDSYFDVLEAIQDDYKPFLIWIIKRLNLKFKWFGEEDIIDIQYHTRDTLNEDEKLDIVGKKVDIANKAGFKVQKDWLAGELNITLEEKEMDPLGKNQKADDEDSDTEESSPLSDISREDEEENKDDPDDEKEK